MPKDGNYIMNSYSNSNSIKAALEEEQSDWENALDMLGMDAETEILARHLELAPNPHSELAVLLSEFLANPICFA